MPVASAVVASAIFSPPPLLIAKRNLPVPALGERNRYRLVPSPKSKMRCQLAPPSQLTHAAMVMRSTPPITPEGMRR